MKPTIGRIVHFKTRGSADGVYPPTNFAGIITKVHNDTCVNLCVFGETGLRFELNVVQGSGVGEWHWPEFVPASSIGGLTTLPPTAVPLPYIPPTPMPNFPQTVQVPYVQPPYQIPGQTTLGATSGTAPSQTA